MSDLLDVHLAQITSVFCVFRVVRGFCWLFWGDLFIWFSFKEMREKHRMSL